MIDEKAMAAEEGRDKGKADSAARAAPRRTAPRKTATAETGVTETGPQNTGQQGTEADAPQTRGRPSGYQPVFADQAAKLCRLGATDADLADFFDVSIRMIERWRGEHEAFSRAVRDAMDEADARVERSLYQRALGYWYDAVKISTVAGEVVQTPYREHYPPDTSAAIFWLRNRKPDQWREKQAVEHKGELVITWQTPLS